MAESLIDIQNYYVTDQSYDEFDSDSSFIPMEQEQDTKLQVPQDLFSDPRKFFCVVTQLQPYDWQRLILLDDSDEISVRVGRQGGKTETIAVKALHEAITRPNFNISIISPTLEQSRIIFKKIERFFMQNTFIKDLIVNNTRTEIYFKNGSNIFVKAGTSVRGYTINLLIVEEAAFVDEQVFVAAEPALMAAGGKMIMISTPFGKIGKFYESFTDPHFSTYWVPGRMIPHIDRDKLARQKEKMSSNDYLREYDAEFVEAAGAYFPLKLIKDNCFMWEVLPLGPRMRKEYYLGVDPSRSGSDETTYAIWEVSKKTIQGEVISRTARMFYVWDEPKDVTAPAIQGRIIDLHNKWNFKCIAMDTTGMAGFLYDNLKLEGLPIYPVTFNAKSPIGSERSHKTEMYSLWKRDMENNQQIRTFNRAQMDKPDNARNLKPYLIMMKSERKLMNQMMDLTYEWLSSGNLKVEAATESIHDDYCDATALGYYAIFINPYMGGDGPQAMALGSR